MKGGREGEKERERDMHLFRHLRNKDQNEWASSVERVPWLIL
jgi:hypothetical protein